MLSRISFQYQCCFLMFEYHYELSTLFWMLFWIVVVLLSGLQVAAGYHCYSRYGWIVWGWQAWPSLVPVRSRGSSVSPSKSQRCSPVPRESLFLWRNPSKASRWSSTVSRFSQFTNCQIKVHVRCSILWSTVPLILIDSNDFNPLWIFCLENGI